MEQAFKRGRARILRIYGGSIGLILIIFLVIDASAPEPIPTEKLFFIALGLAISLGITLLQRYIVLDGTTVRIQERTSYVIAREDVLGARAYRTLRAARSAERFTNRPLFSGNSPCLVLHIREGSAKRTWWPTGNDADLFVLFPQDPEKVARAITTWAAVPEDASRTRPHPA